MVSKKTKEVKITEDELANLKKIVFLEQEVTESISRICLEKEVTLRSYNKSFDEKYELLEIKNNSLIEKRNKMLEALNAIYGQEVKYDLNTGLVTSSQENNGLE